MSAIGAQGRRARAEGDPRGGLSVCSGACGLHLLSAAIRMPWASLAVLLVGRSTIGIGESLLVTGVVIWGIARAGPGRTGAAMSWNGMAQYGALAAGAPVGFAVHGWAGLPAFGLATVILPLVSLGVVLPLAPAPAAAGTRLPLRSVLRRIRRPGLAMTSSAIGFAAVSTFASLDFAARGWDGGGLALLAYGGCFVLVRLVAGDLPDRLSGFTVAAGSMIVEALGQVLVWAAPGPILALVGAGLTGLGCSLVFPSLAVDALRRVPSESRGIAVSAFAGFQDVAIGLTGPVLGAVASASTPAGVFLVGTLAAVSATSCGRWRSPPRGGVDRNLPSRPCGHPLWADTSYPRADPNVRKVVTPECRVLAQC